VIGEYLGKIYQEVKRRPRYIIEKLVGRGEASPRLTTDQDPLARLERAG